MIRQPEHFPETVKEVRRQLALSQEGLALERAGWDISTQIKARHFIPAGSEGEEVAS